MSIRSQTSYTAGYPRMRPYDHDDRALTVPLFQEAVVLLLQSDFYFLPGGQPWAAESRGPAYAQVSSLSS